MSVGEHPSGLAGSDRAGGRQSGQVSFLDQALWKQFSEAKTQGAFVQAWLALQCRLVPGVTCGVVVLGETAGGPYAPAAFWPDKESGSAALASVAELALAEERGVVQGDDSEGAAAQGCAVAYPLRFQGELYGVVSIEVERRSSGQLRSTLRQLQWGVSWIEVLLLRERGREKQVFVDRAAAALDIVATALADERFLPACNATATELARQLDCDQVSIGFVKSGHAGVVAVSHAAQFGRRMNLIRDIGAAMDEAIDQGCAVLYPPAAEGEYRVTRAHAELARAHCAGSILTVPLAGSGRDAYGALTFQRPPDADFDQAAIDVCDSVAAVVGPILREKRRNDRWIGVKVVESLAEQARRLFGAGYAGRKLAVVVMAALIAFFSLYEDDFRVTSEAVLEGLIQRVIVAPFDGYIETEAARAGEIVRLGQVLATLNDKDLALERLRWSTTRRQRLTEFDRALAERDRADINIIKAQIDQAEAQIALLDEQLARVKLTAPFDGIVVAGDLSQSIGASVSRGEELFQVAPLDAYRVILQVDEGDVANIAAGQSGTILLSSIPNEPLAFTVERVTPVAEAREGRNYFRVEARLDQASERLRPGMEGVAKTSVEQRLLIWIWTRRLIDWTRLALWKWIP